MSGTKTPDSVIARLRRMVQEGSASDGEKAALSALEAALAGLRHARDYLRRPRFDPGMRDGVAFVVESAIQQADASAFDQAAEVYSRTVTVRREEISAKLIDDLKVLHGLPPHNSGGNICMNDGYYAASLRQKYGDDLINAATQLVIQPMQDRLAAVMREFEASEAQVGGAS